MLPCDAALRLDVDARGGLRYHREPAKGSARPHSAWVDEDTEGRTSEMSDSVYGLIDVSEVPEKGSTSITAPGS